VSAAGSAGDAASRRQGGAPLIDLSVRQKGNNRLFFAVIPEAAAARRAQQLGQALRQRHGLKGKLQDISRLHVTLLYLNDFVDEAVEAVAAAGEAAATLRDEPFAVVFDEVMSFERSNNRPLVLRGGAGLRALEAFQRRLEEALCERFILPRTKPYTPHLTLLHDDRGVPRQSIEPIGWTVREFALMRSLLGHSRHVAVARWPLRRQG
jgi:2'-5' RNA ligase